MGKPALPEFTPSEVAWRQAAASAAKVWRRLGLPGARILALAPTRDEMKLFGIKASYATAAIERLVCAKSRITLEVGPPAGHLSDAGEDLESDPGLSAD